MREHPFGVTPNPHYLYFGATHREALASLACGIEADRGFMALIARPGMGKTSLLFHLLNRLRDSARTVFLFQTQCDSREFLRYLLTDMGFDTRGQDLSHMHELLNRTLLQEAKAGRRFVLVVDEAQNLDDSVLETVRLLSDFETPSAKLMQIVLAGQPQLAEKLGRPALAQLRQRISSIARLRPLDSREIQAYIDHRLRIAGYQGSALFSPEAMNLVAAASEGIPRSINNLCFNALSLCFVLERKTIDAGIMTDVLRDLDLDLSRLLEDHQKPEEAPPVLAAIEEHIPARNMPAPRDLALKNEEIGSVVAVAEWPLTKTVRESCNERPPAAHSTRPTVEEPIQWEAANPGQVQPVLIAGSGSCRGQTRSSQRKKAWRRLFTLIRSKLFNPARPLAPTRQAVAKP
jgi:type II secretory pathway predicted ATPase ExeA